MTGQLQLSLLGKLEIRYDGRPVANLTSAKAQALLCYLAVTGRPHFRTSLAGLLWPDMPDANARANLRRELSTLRGTVGAHLLISRHEVAFNRDAPYWLDVEAFEAAADQSTIEGLQEAADLYRGDFLEGFCVRDAPDFEEWVLVLRTRLRERALQALHKVATHYAAQGEQGLEGGIATTSRLLALEPSREEAHRQLMSLLAQSGQRGAALAQYELCRQALADDLGVEPGPETQELYQRIRDGDVGRQPAGRRSETLPSRTALRDTGAKTLPSTEHLPAFLTDDERPEPDRPVFVTRERELERLGGYLEQALAGNGQVVFITGGPGRGKTALMTEFARCAMDRHSGLLLGMGNCNAFSGVGDPYLPFREVLAMLTGDLEPRWAAGVISRAHACRLWAAVPQVLSALMDHGPSLIGTLLSGPTLLSRASDAGGSNSRLDELRRWLERRGDQGERLQQDAVFEQCTNTLRALSSHHPLLMLLDDLQWTDSASAGLLFHLGRRLAGTRMLILGTYRPEEVALALEGALVTQQERARHPLDKVLSELRRQFGDVWLDLSRTEELEHRRFVDALLDTESNRLGEDFRDALAKHTDGHALFTVELLRSMQDRGDVVRDRDGAWVQRGPLDWDRLPARVEAVIDERMGRLDPELHDVLSAASVEGEEFTAQVVARVQGMDERRLLHLLSQELEKRHRLVREQGGQFVDGHRLSRYRFGHALFQAYVYSELSEAERVLLHQEVAGALEELYAGNLEEVAVQLAHHYACSGDAKRECCYAQMFVRWAAALGASEETVRVISRSLELTPEADRAKRYVLLLARQDQYATLGEREAEAADLTELARLAESFKDEQQADARKAEVLVLRSKFDEVTGDFSGALAASQAAANYAEAAQNPALIVWANWQWALMQSKLGDIAGARTRTESALALAQASGQRFLEGICTRSLGLLCLAEGDFDGAEFYFQSALAIARESFALGPQGWVMHHLGTVSAQRCQYRAAEAYFRQAMEKIRPSGWRLGEAAVVRALAELDRLRGDYSAAKAGFEQSASDLKAIGEPEFQHLAIAGMGCVLRDLGDYSSARTCFERALLIFQKLGALDKEGRVQSQQSLLNHLAGDGELALEQSQRALTCARDTGIPNDEADAFTHLGHAQMGLGQLEEAADAYRRALKIRLRLGQSPLAAEVRAGLARVAISQGEPAQALAHVEQILIHLETGTSAARPEGSESAVHAFDGTDEPMRIYLTCYHVLRANADPRAEEILEEAYTLLQRRAAKIDDADLHRSYLENVAANREIIAHRTDPKGFQKPLGSLGVP